MMTIYKFMYCRLLLTPCGMFGYVSRVCKCKVIVGKVGNYSKYRWVLVNIIPFYSLETEVSRVVKYSRSLNNM